MKIKEKIFIFTALKLLWIIAILFALLALRLELLVHNGEISSFEVDSTYMLKCLTSSGIMLILTSYLCVRYI